MPRMTTFSHAECPTCGWEVLLPPVELAALGGCRLCGGPLAVEDSRLPWHGRAHPERMRPA